MKKEAHTHTQPNIHQRSWPEWCLFMPPFSQIHWGSVNYNDISHRAKWIGGRAAQTWTHDSRRLLIKMKAYLIALAVWAKAKYEKNCVDRWNTRNILSYTHRKWHDEEWAPAFITNSTNIGCENESSKRVCGFSDEKNLASESSLYISIFPKQTRVIMTIIMNTERKRYQ